MTLLEKAAAFAAMKHAGQTRKYTGEPYIVHPTAVAEMVKLAGGDEAAIAAAFLHDTLEDTDTSFSELAAEFGTEIANLVNELTDHFTPTFFPKLNRAARKMLETERLATISKKAKMVKLADIADNTASIVAHDPAFAKVYLVEKAAMLKVLT
jgi:(p)ppGpp synthase/HD superfamily hydrolase